MDAFACSISSHSIEIRNDSPMNTAPVTPLYTTVYVAYVDGDGGRARFNGGSYTLGARKEAVATSGRGRRRGMGANC